MSNWWESFPLSAQQGVAVKNVSAADKKLMADADDAANMTNRLSTVAQDFAARNARVKTGGLLSLPFAASAAKAFGVGGPDLSAMDRDSMTMANSMKAAGSRLTQMEFKNYLGGVPNLQTKPSMNQSNAQAIFNTNTAAAAYQSYLRTYQQVHGNLAGAPDGWRQFQAQHFGPDGTYYHDPATNPALQPNQGDPRAQANAALKAKSGLPVLLGVEQ